MRLVLNAVGIVLVVLGGVWFLQGIGVLPGSFMTGQTQWALYGGIAMLAGIAAIAASRRMRRP
jgi:uncharacterized membrane protein HdeD (DUF308 family)